MSPNETKDQSLLDQQPVGAGRPQQEVKDKPDVSHDTTSAPTVEGGESSDAAGHIPNISAPNSGEGPSPDKAMPTHQTLQSLDGRMTYTWLRDVSSRLSSLEDKAKTSKSGPNKAEPSGAAEAPQAFMYQTIPKVRDCNWEQFKNRFPSDKGVCAIEVLLSSRYLDEEIESEQLKRLTPEKKLEALAARKRSRRRRQRDSSPRRFERVRVNSAHVLTIFAKITGEKWAGKPQTFLKPFSALIYYHSQMATEYLNIREILATKEEATPTSDTQECVKQNKNVRSEESSRKTLEDMKCYIEFMEQEIMPIYMMFDSIDSNKPAKVRHSDLWSLFRVGELVKLRPANKSKSDGRAETVRPSGGLLNAEDSQAVNSGALVGRIFWKKIYTPDRTWEISDLSKTGSGGGRLHLDEDSDSDGSDEEFFIIIGFYYIDYDGDEYKAVCAYIRIYSFIGEKDITALRVFPLRFAKDHEQIVQDLQASGQRFKDIIGQSSHARLSYKGRTLTQNPLDEVDEGREGVALTPSIYIDSDIIVDFREAYKSHPEWKPGFSQFEKSYLVARRSEDRFAVVRWADAERTEVVERIGETIYEDATSDQECDQFLETLEGRFLLDRDHWTPSQVVAGTVLSKDDLVMLPSRLFAYSLRDRKFTLANIRCIKQSSRLDVSSTFDKLRISDTHKGLIESLVFEHFEKKEAQRKGTAQNLEISDQDFIVGKGRGLVMLLHGAPGVGKTATAEAVAYLYNKPLFPITCGNLGIEPGVVEEKLTELFRLASLWDCILLLDEAEIFLSPRAKTDDNLQRNAIVSVFLRVLEYYSGVLFLTTNRSGALDEAVKSRVHLSLLYPHLGYNETMSLFKMNIERLEQIEQETAKITGREVMNIEVNGIMDFAQKHYEKFAGDLEDSRWNGRQIRNAFQIAASLARYQHHRQPHRPGTPAHRSLYVGGHHFEQVEDATFQYDEFRFRIAKKTESQLALARGDRGPDLPQPRAHSPAPDWNAGLRRSAGVFRQESATSPQLGRLRSSNPNATSHSRGGGSARDSRGDYGASLSPDWSLDGGSSTPSPSQGRGHVYSPHGTFRAEGGGEHAWDQRYTGSETARMPSDEPSR